MPNVALAGGGGVPVVGYDEGPVDPELLAQQQEVSRLLRLRQPGENAGLRIRTLHCF